MTNTISLSDTVVYVRTICPRPGHDPGSSIVDVELTTSDGMGCRGEVRLSTLLADHPHDPSPWGDDAPAAVWCSAADRITALFGDEAPIVLRSLWRASWEAAVAWLRADRARRDTQEAYDRARAQEVAARLAEARGRLERAETELKAAIDAAIACGAIEQVEPAAGWEDRAVERARREGVLPLR